ncbi:hypothetical protein [Paraburkholderia sp. BL10I2N1]|uniref:hypothetical protein n=1 Tax=Paraburkholderia sp. BL10I2N1 TaxID=1938796 RepID=UPI00105E56F5|nr:hypothetical protein [Paraburkholderia sp. BL10I2N1]TDN69517.1 hypothetical protein B0G77_2916 [Paraburkholderia sp. BL10I2N1]
MQIGNSNTVVAPGNAGSSSAARRSVAGADVAAQAESAGDDAREAVGAVEPVVAASHDSAVNISAAGVAAASHDTSGSQQGDTSDSSAAKDRGDDQDDPAQVSSVKSFAYGALGLERPDQPKENNNTCYSAGKWLAAGLTLGGIISLLV